MFTKIDVNGPMTHPLYQYLKSKKTGQEGKPDIEWNFGKFLLNRQGDVVERFHPRTEPHALVSHIEALLKA
jgi:glutathione peroxidase